MKSLIARKWSTVTTAATTAANAAVAAVTPPPPGPDRARGSAGPPYAIDQFGNQLTAISEGLVTSSLKHRRDANTGSLVGALMEATEALVWGEKHNGALFDLFCERHMLSHFITAFLAPSTPQPVRVQLLQTLSILVANARRETTTFYMFSGGRLNLLLAGDPNLDDEEVRAYFVAFIKSLALRIDADTALLFLDQRHNKAAAGDFPLFAQAVRFAMHKDQMASTAARTALLSLLNISHPEVRRCTVDATRKLLVPSLAEALRVAWSAAAVAVRLWDAETLRRALEAEEDLYGFFCDLLEVGVDAIRVALTQGILGGAFVPLLAGLAPRLAYPEYEAEVDIDTEMARYTNKELWSALDESMEDPELPPGAVLASPNNGAAREEVARATCQLLRPSSGLGPAQQGLVGAVIENIVFGKPLQPAQDEALRKPLQPVVKVVDTGATKMVTMLQKLRAAGELPAAEGVPKAPGRPLEEPLTAAIALRAVAACAHAARAHRDFMTPIADVLLGATAECNVVQAAYTPGPEGAALAVAALGAEADQAGSPIPNPFREAALALLARDGAGPVGSEAPLLAWALVELRASCPGLKAAPVPPEELVNALVAQAGLPRIAQRAVATAAAELAAPGRTGGNPAAEDRRRDVAASTATALRGAGELLRAAAAGCIEGKAVAADDVVAAFLEEWEWDARRSSAIELPATCGSVQCLLQCAHGRRQKNPDDSTSAADLARHAARALLTLRRLYLAVSSGADRKESHAEQEDGPVQEPCPLSAEAPGAAAGCEDGAHAHETISCVGPGGAACSFVLHPARLVVASRQEDDPLGGEGCPYAESIAWRVTVSADSDPLRATFRIAPPVSCNPNAPKEVQELSLSFPDAQGRTRALQHLEARREQQLQDLLAELAAFVDRTIRVHSLFSV